ncbi:MAG: penicillin-binding protein activator LpoB [Magnetococcales bacterium]|nr:penicillin-binding protein activator LpoB [Magnetococcales bacterium]
MDGGSLPPPSTADSCSATFTVILRGWALVLVVLAGCTTYDTSVDDAPGRPTVYNDPATVGPMAGVGVESQDVVAMADKMMRDMLASPILSGRTTPPRVIIDSSYFHNESSSRINKNIITDRLRNALMRSAQGRMRFVGRHAIEAVEKERTLKRSGVVDAATVGLAQKTQGADFRLVGRITSLDALRPGTGDASRFHQFSFEMIDLETGEIVWSNMYDFKKTAQDDIIYQ